MRQEFKTTDMVRLEVQDGWPDLPNLIENPNGEGGASGWRTLTSLGWTITSVPGPALLQTRTSGTFRAVGGNYGGIDIPRVSAPDTVYVRAWLTVDAASTPPAGQLGAGFQVAARSAVTGISNGLVPHDDATETLVPGTYEFPPIALPEDTDGLSLTLYMPGPVGGAPAELKFRGATLIVGTLTEVTASDLLTEPPWTNILGSTHEISTERDELDAGFLNATVYDSTLDPASFDLIRPGKRCRCLVQVGGVWEPIFTGLLDNPSTAYLVKDPKVPALKRARIQLVANDPAAQLAAAPRSNGVGTIAELPAVLLGAGVPWSVNGSTDAFDPDDAVIVAINDSASALDQVAITRDSVQGYAWIDRAGTVQAWDADQIPATVVLEVDEDDYSDLNVDFDLGRLINSVIVRLSRINPGTGDTEEVEYGPYDDPASIREWRTRRAEFRVQGIDDADIPAFAAAVLAANATPARRINEVTLPLRTVAEVEAKALTDLYDLVEASNDLTGITGQQSRVTSVKHSLVAGPTGGRWSMTLGFSTEGSVAVPQVTPAPGATGKTLAQLMRPVGEVTMWFGAKADIPAGWLPLDGDTFDADTYPDLAVLLGDNVVPDFTDRFPIGAGSKALGTIGGNVIHSHPLSAAGQAQTYVSGTAVGQRRVATVGYTSTHAVTAAAGSTGSSTVGAALAGATDPADHTPPWVALWFIIRGA